MNTERILKVSSITNTYKTVTYPRYKYTTVPFIKLAGKYLESIDISIGDHVKISTRKGKIIIEKI
jgi:formylmethanofuran dehydrogenase subunit D